MNPSEPSEKKCLDNFLSELGAPESSGKFTISTKEALKKLGRSQLPDPHLWLAKIFQVAHRFKAPRFSAKEQNRSVVIEMSCPPHWTLERVSEALLSPEVSVDPALNHMVTGIRAAVLGLGLL